MIRALIDLAMHRYIRTGEIVHLYQGRDVYIGSDKVIVTGWGIYGAVAVGQGYIRRDGIVKDGEGRWTYHFED